MAETIINFCPRCGAAISSMEKFGKTRPVCSQCGWVHFSDPKVAAAVLIKEDGKVLLVRRGNDPERGKWTLPAGFVDGGENPIHSAERECLEETGLKVKVTGLLDVIPGLEHARGADILIVYEATILEGTLLAQDDADKAEWFQFNNLPPLAFSATRQILKPFQDHQ
ncbi:MAG TPA: NUDIX hydrolase [Anaerolineales bacterium]|nr:NUDIX hydrolase [Anaerolineales bacterium]